MKISSIKTFYLVTVFSLVSLSTHAAEREELLIQYASQSEQKFSEERGKLLWEKSVKGEAPFTQRSCSSCHTRNVTINGKHIRTNKEIKALAPSVNSESLNEAKNIEKWFSRNCKWTFGRKCSSQEKGDILTYLQNQ